MMTDYHLYPATGRFMMGRMRQIISTRDRRILEDLVVSTKIARNGQKLYSRGNDIDHFSILVEGFAFSCIDDSKSRCILGLHMPGDLLDVSALPLHRLDYDLVALGSVVIGQIDKARFQHLIRSEPNLTQLIWMFNLCDAAIQRQWTLKLSKLTASRRLAHMIAEIWTRLELIGLARSDGFETPLTQAHLADMCGTTPIHMNRSVRELREVGIADFRRGRIQVEDRAALHEYGGFESSYLFLDKDSETHKELEPIG